jgi:DNA-binding transcriptional ArsR family regulator
MQALPQAVSTDNPPTTPSGASPHPQRFDHKTYQQLDGYDAKILEEINYLSGLQRKKSPTGARYCTPSEEYLSQKLGIRREAVSRHISKLSNLGILRVTHRHKRNGQWQTNLYTIISWVWWRLGQALKSLRVSRQPCAPIRTHNSPMREKENQERSKGAPTAIKSTLMALFEQVKAGQKLAIT